MGLYSTKFSVAMHQFSLMLKINRPTSVTLSSDNCGTIIKQLSDESETVVGRIDFNIHNISLWIFYVLQHKNQPFYYVITEKFP